MTGWGTGHFKEKVFRFFGVLQKLYNVLGGYVYYNSITVQSSVHKLSQNSKLILCILQ